MSDTQQALKEFLAYLPESLHPKLLAALEQMKEGRK
jgi:hypothetical protein